MFGLLYLVLVFICATDAKQLIPTKMTAWNFSIV